MKFVFKAFPLCCLLLTCYPPSGPEITQGTKNNSTVVKESLQHTKNTIHGLPLEHITRIQEFSSSQQARLAFAKAIPQKPKAQGERGLLHWARSEYAIWLLKDKLLTYIMFLPPGAMNWKDISPEKMKEVQAAIDWYFEKITQENN